MSHNLSKRSLILAMLFFLALVFIQRPAFAQGQELVKNGGFESGLQGWTAVSVLVLAQNQLGYHDALSHPPHSGQYSAEVGTVAQVGTLDQTVTIPAKSKATFSAWFRIEQGATLTIALKASDGSTIRQWSESGSQQWSQVTYDLSDQYASQSVTVEFTGQAMRIPLLYSYADYFAFVDDVSIIASVAEYTVNVNVSGLPAGLSTNLVVDGTQSSSISGGQSQQFTFPIGETHTISIKDSVYQDNTTRYHCESPSTSVNTDSQLNFSYTKQYYFSVDSPYATVSGSGWYDDGSKPSFSIDSATSPMPGLIGTLGAKYVFTGWSAGISTGTLENSIVMDNPESVSATWTEDYTSVYLLAATIIAGVIGAIVVIAIFARRRDRRGATMLYDEHAGPVIIDVSAPVTEVKESERTQVKEDKSTKVAEQSEKTDSRQESNRDADRKESSDGK